jgi:hypothetical protein
MTSEEIIKEIERCLEALDQLISPRDGKAGKYASARANRDFQEKKVKAILAIEKRKHTGSDANRTMEAEASEEYSDTLWKLAECQGMAYQAQAEKDLLETKIDCLRSMLSHEKSQINRTI